MTLHATWSVNFSNRYTCYLLCTELIRSILCLQKDENKKQSGCVKNNIGYEGRCSRCPDRVVYIGETSKPAYTHFKQDCSNYRAASAAKLSAMPTPRPGSSEYRKDVKSWVVENWWIRRMNTSLQKMSKPFSSSGENLPVWPSIIKLVFIFYFWRATPNPKLIII